MFKEQLFKQDEGQQKGQREKKEQNSQPNRNNVFGIKVISNWHDENRNNSGNGNKIPQYKSPLIKQDPQLEVTSKVQSIRGIKVISSRQGSNQRPLATSRSHSRRKQSRQIKSQTNISEFESATNTKQPSIEKYSPSKGDQESIYLSYQQRFREAMLKQSAFYEAEIEQLSEIISSNQERINNLIGTLNILVESGQKKERIISKLESRMNSNQKYAQQCYTYTLSRCTDSEIVLRHLKEEIERNNNKNIQIENKMEYIERIIIDIFTIQKSLFFHQQLNFDKELSSFHQNLRNLEQKLNHFPQLQLRHGLEEMRNNNLKEYLLDLKEKLQISKGYQPDEGTRDVKSEDYSWINRQELSIKLQNLSFKISQLDNAKITLAEEFKSKEQNSQHAIWELSSMLNKQEREVEIIQKQNNELLNYNKQIENKLIQARCRENTLRSYMQSQLKMLQSAKNEENLRIFQENKVFREKYQQIFRHNQYLQEMNCKNNLQLLNNDKIVQELQFQLKSLQTDKEKRLRSENQQLKQELQTLKRRIFQMERNFSQNQSKVYMKQMELDKISAECISLRQKIDQFQFLKKQIEELTVQKQSSLAEHDKLYHQFVIIRKDLDEQVLYSEHLQQENQKLQSKLAEYTQNFEEQSLMFKITIDKLKKEKVELVKNLDNNKTDRTIASSNNSNTTNYKHNSSVSRAQQSKLFQLKKAIETLGYKTPVSCQIDGTGYLKHLEKGTYIVDQQQNLFELSLQQKHLAIKLNLIQLFQ